MATRKKTRKIVLSMPTPPPSDWATRIPLLLDMPGLFFVEACKRMARGTEELDRVLAELKQHRTRVSSAASTVDPDAAEDAWVDVIQSVGSLEPLFGAAISDLAVADVLLAAAAESYINAIASHVLSPADGEHFEKLSPVGKWLFLPKIMKLKWQPDLGQGCLQQFASVVARRNRAVHPRPIKAASTAQVEQFIKQLRLDANSAQAGADSVRNLIREISLSWRGASGPDWLTTEKAAKRPPCFILGSVEGPARLGRKRAKRKHPDA